jgi:hypothetical protein
MNGFFSEEALERFAQLAAQTQAANFAEGDFYDFTRCVRPNGTAYGTGGKCRKGTEGGPAEKAAKTRKSRNTITPGQDLAKQHAAEMGVSAAKLGKEYERLLKKNPDMDLSDLYQTAQKNLKAPGSASGSINAGRREAAKRVVGQIAAQKAADREELESPKNIADMDTKGLRELMANSPTAQRQLREVALRGT